MTKEQNIILEIKNLSKTFKAEIAAGDFTLQNINYQLKKGEVACLIGPSGSGKTTLLQLIGLLDSPTSGEIIIDGITTSNQKDSVKTQIRRNKIGFIYQFHNLLPEFSALENAALPILIQGKDKDEAFSAAKEPLTKVGLGNRLDYKPSQLSGGQQQRVAICRAFTHRPSLILADEPTGNLDSKNSDNVFELLLSLAKEEGVSCLIVTHNLQLANKVNKKIAIQDGSLSESIY